tara:strand:- start:1921 stop:2115 length:195 start_codon:yes stop_codon:yes gene_type:complete
VTATPTTWTAAREADDTIRAFEAEVFAATGMGRRDIARADSTDLITIHDCWHRASSGQETSHDR